MTTSEQGEFKDPRAFLSRHGLAPKDSFGQCFLIAPPVARAIIEALGTHPDQTLVEIGTGTGTLARMAAPRFRHVMAIERDRDLVAALRGENLPPNVQVIEQDAAAFDYAGLAASEPLAIIGNLPYQITGKLLRAVLTPPVQWRVAIVMVQKEVASRLLAHPGDRDWGIMGVFASAACEVTRVVNASPGCFYPAPRVTSTVVKLTPRAVPLASETESFRRVVHALFAARRKTLRNGLAALSEVGRERATLVCERAGIDPGRRAETLTISELGALTESL